MINTLYLRDNTGVYASSRRMVRWMPKFKPPTGLRLVQFCHGYGASAQTFNELGKLIQLLWDSGRYLPFSADQGGAALFGGSGVTTDIEAANQYMVDKYGAKSDKKAYIGYSMGFLNAAQEVYANPTTVAAILGVAPFINGTNIYSDAGAGSIQTDMDAAAGGSWASVDAARSPAQNTSSFSGIHVECWQGTSDTTVRPADTSTFCSNTGGTYHAVGGTHGTVWINITFSEILAALDAASW